MAQINYSREKLENMSQRTIKQAQAILEKYSKDPKASPLDKQNWEATSQHLSDVSAKIDQAWEVAKSYGVTFGGKSKDLLTLAEIHELTQEQIHDSGKTASKITDIMDKIDSMKIGTSEKEKFKVWAKDKDLSGKLATGLLGFGIAEMALSALGIGKAAAGATAAAGAAGATAAGGTAVGAVLGTVVPGAFQFLGNAVVGLWNLSNPAFLAISLFAAMKVIPHVKSFMSKHGARKEKEFSNELDAISAQNQDGVRKKQERKEEKETSGYLADNDITPADLDGENKAQQYNDLNAAMDKQAELNTALAEKVEELGYLSGELQDLNKQIKNNPGDKKAREDAEQVMAQIEAKIREITKLQEELKEASKNLQNLANSVKSSTGKAQKIQRLAQELSDGPAELQTTEVIKQAQAAVKEKEKWPEVPVMEEPVVEEPVVEEPVVEEPVVEEPVVEEPVVEEPVVEEPVVEEPVVEEPVVEEPVVEEPVVEEPVVEEPVVEEPVVEEPVVEEPVVEEPVVEEPVVEEPVVEEPVVEEPVVEEPTTDVYSAAVTGMVEEFKTSLKGLNNQHIQNQIDKLTRERDHLTPEQVAMVGESYDLSIRMLEKIKEQRRKIAEAAQGRHKNPTFDKSNATYIEEAGKQVLAELGSAE